MENLEFYTLVAALVIYLIASLLYSAQLIVPAVGNKIDSKFISKLAAVFTASGLILNSSTLLIRYIHSGYPPLGNMYEFLLFFVWGIVLMYLIVETKYNVSYVGVLALPLVAGLMVWVIFMDKTLRPLMPALRSNWLYFHVFTAVISYGAFAVSFVIGILYLIKEGSIGLKKQRGFLFELPKLEILEDLTYRLILVGMPFLTLVIITGAIWAEIAWSSYWSWDPKETWSLITWFIYAGYLHTRLMKNWRGKKSIILVVLGFAAVMFTFAGVNLLLPGLHSYA
ncbi:MAG: hypothetical protein VR72_19675 [Clostridiaceae bacterium BRH_c20a]|nr:MAG: hypothetical protein VR72_19675 [Clostridiaceae bacterium BRH_c20a]